jgi:hypothetical protein
MWLPLLPLLLLSLLASAKAWRMGRMAWHDPAFRGAGGGGVLVRGERVGVQEPPAVDRVVEVPPLHRAPVWATVRLWGHHVPREDAIQLRVLAVRKATDAEPSAALSPWRGRGTERERYGL